MTSTLTRPARTGAASKDPARSGTRRARTAISWIVFAIALIIALVWLFPFIIVVFTSLQQHGRLTTDLATWFSSITAGNFAQAWDQANMGLYLGNSAIVTFIKVPLGLVVSGMCAFGLSRFRFRFRSGVIVAIIALAAIPIQIGLISIFRMVLDLGLLNSYVGLILVYLAFGVPFQTAFLVAYFNQIPTEIEESARLDGSGPWRYLWKIVLPLSVPLLAALFVLDFVATWNEFPIALTLLQDSSLWTTPLGLLGFQGPFSSNYQLISAGIVIAAIPVLVIYVAMQRFFVSGLTTGAVKG